MQKITEPTILSVLRDIMVPGTKQNIVDSRIVTNVTLRDEKHGMHVSFVMEIDPKHAAMFEPVRKDAETKITKLSGVSSVSVVLTAHKTPTAAPTQPSARPKIAIPNVKKIIAVASGKGGVGKSTTAVNIAIAMAMNGLKVGLLDADIYGPSIPRMLKLSGKPESTDDNKMIPMERYGLAAMSMGFLIGEDMPMIWRGPMVHSAIQQLFRDVAWGERDIIVVDMPPGTGDAHLTLAQQVPLAGAVIVSTPQDIALIDARKGLNMFQRVEVPVLGIIENMSYFACPHCGERTDVFGHGGARDEAAKLNLPFLGEVPLNIAIRETSDQGDPITISSPDSDLAKNYRAIAAMIWKGLN